MEKISSDVNTQAENELTVEYLAEYQLTRMVENGLIDNQEKIKNMNKILGRTSLYYGWAGQ